MNWSPQQETALRTVARWMRDPNANQVMYLAGYAGTGKSTLAKELVDDAGKKWLFAAYTGKAAHVLRTKGCDDAATIHSLIYRPAGEASAQLIAELEAELTRDGTSSDRRSVLIDQIVDLRKNTGPRFTRWDTGPLSLDDVEGIVVDEVSMVDGRIGRDLEFFGKKILVLGDPAQLPPVKGGGYFTARTPDVMLTEVHRHDLESGIFRLATHIREGGSLSGFDSLGPDVQLMQRAIGTREERAHHALAADQVLVGLNKTRRDLNKRQRELRDRNGILPYEGDRLVCLRNEAKLGIFNGSQWIVVDAVCDESKPTGKLCVRSEDKDNDRMVVSRAWLHNFLGRDDELKSMGQRVRDHSEFDWGYALTVHKAQGSQWDRVLVVDESTSLGDPRRWLYTAVTRAVNHVTVLM